MKLLIVEDEAPAAAYLRRGLSEEGYAVDVAADAAQARRAAALFEYDAILLDVMLPGGDGFALCRRWREAGLTTPVLFLTARDAVSDRVQGLDTGGDDYLVKPFAFDELLARVRVLVRRQSAPGRAAVLRVGELVVETHTQRVTRGGRDVPLTAREYQLLEYLVYHTDKLVTRFALWEHVWESGSEPDSNVVDVYMRYLRNKLGRDPDLIETVRGRGYVLRGAGADRAT